MLTLGSRRKTPISDELFSPRILLTAAELYWPFRWLGDARQFVLEREGYLPALERAAVSNGLLP